MNAFALGDAPTLAAVWDQLYRRVSPEGVAVEVLGRQGTERLTYKELNARAHCLAAYLLSKGLGSAEPVLIISQAQVQLVPLDLGVQLAGGVSVVVGGDGTLAQLQQTLAAVQPSAILVADLATYRRLQGALDGYVSAAASPHRLLPEVIVATVPSDEAKEADRATLLDRAIELGKVYWREQTALVKAAKDAIDPDQTAIWFVDASGELSSLTHRALISSGLKAAEALTALGPADRVLSLVQPQQPFGRLTLLLTLSAGLPLLMTESLARTARAPMELRPSVVVALPRQLNWLEHRIRPRRGALARYWPRVLAASARRQHLLSGGQPVPLGLRLVHRLAAAWFYTPLRQRTLRSVRHILTLEAGLSGALSHTFEQLGLRPQSTLGGRPVEQWVAPQPVAQSGDQKPFAGARRSSAVFPS